MWPNGSELHLQRPPKFEPRLMLEQLSGLFVREVEALVFSLDSIQTLVG